MKEKFLRKLYSMDPIVLVMLLILLVDAVSDRSMSMGDWFINKLLMLPGIVIGLSFHEAAHALVSYKLGDPTPKLQGRVTLNPFKHFDVTGFFALLLIGFGWGIPVQIDPRYYKNRRVGEMMVGLAGVTTNLLIAVAFAFITRGLVTVMSFEFYETFGATLIQILVYVVYINLVLMVFNLLPVPPLDGFGVLTQIFHLDRCDWYYTVYRNGYYILLALIIFNIPSKIIGPVTGFFYELLLF